VPSSSLFIKGLKFFSVTWMLSSMMDFPLEMVEALEARRRVPGSAIDDLRRITIDLRRSMGADSCVGDDASLGEGSVSARDAFSFFACPSIFIKRESTFRVIKIICGSTTENV
jgi:hypothetical protein